MMTEIIVHRATTNSCENCIEGIKVHIKSGFGVELDLREKNNSVYMSHDEMEVCELFEDACRLCSNVPAMLALHIKEIKDGNAKPADPAKLQDELNNLITIHHG